MHLLLLLHVWKYFQYANAYHILALQAVYLFQVLSSHCQYCRVLQLQRNISTSTICLLSV